MNTTQKLSCSCRTGKNSPYYRPFVWTRGVCLETRESGFEPYSSGLSGGNFSPYHQPFNRPPMQTPCSPFNPWQPIHPCPPPCPRPCPPPCPPPPCPPPCPSPPCPPPFPPFPPCGPPFQPIFPSNIYSWQNGLWLMIGFYMGNNCRR